MKTRISTVVLFVLFGTFLHAQKFPLTVTYNAQNPLCHDENNGLIELFVVGGAAPYTFIWNDGTTANFKSHIPAGTYDILVKDAANISVGLSVTLTNPNPLEINGNVLSVSSTGGNNGAIDVSIYGTAGSFTYEWATNSGSGINPYALDQSGLTAGSYTLTIINTNGCELSRTFVISQPMPHVNPFNGHTNTFVSSGGPVHSTIAFPNPSHGEVNFKSDETVKSIVIYDMNGFLVQTIENTEKNIPSVDLKSGNYTAVITLATGVTSNEHIVVR